MTDLQAVRWWRANNMGRWCWRCNREACGQDTERIRSVHIWRSVQADRWRHAS